MQDIEREPLECPNRAARYGKYQFVQFCIFVLDGFLNLSRSVDILGVSGAFKLKQRHARHRAGATRVPQSSRTMKITENTDLYIFAFLWSMIFRTYLNLCTF